MSMQQVIDVQENNTYGTRKLYPVNDQAKLLCEALGGQKTITDDNVTRFKKMGFIFRQVVCAGDKIVTVGEL